MAEKKKRYGHNEGSISQRKDGTYEVRVTVGITPDGKPKRKSVYCKTLKEAKTTRIDLLNNLQKGLITNPTEMKLGDWLDEYMSLYKKPYVKPTTYVTYTVKVENHIKPAIGRYKLKALRQDIIQKFINSLTDKGLAPATVEAIYKLLHNALETAVDNGMLVRNTAHKVRLPKVPKPKISPLSKEQQDTFVEKAKETYMGCMYIFDLCTGMRLGEVLGLQWGDIDLEEKTLEIKRTLSKVKDPDNPDESWHLAFGSPKTKASERTIPLSETAVKVLLDVMEQQKQNKAKAGTAYEDNNLVFCTQLGRPLDPVNMRRTFYSICNKAGISGLHPHCLRHTFATRGVESGVDVRVMQSFLGHANFQETVDIYTHVSGDLKRQEMQKLNSTMNY